MKTLLFYNQILKAKSAGSHPSPPKILAQGPFPVFQSKGQVAINLGKIHKAGHSARIYLEFPAQKATREHKLYKKVDFRRPIKYNNKKLGETT